jgi:peptidoglycan/LPS O-acetylase OafA/YrhL
MSHPGTTQKLYTLELGRFIAAMVVVLTHALPELNQQAAPGTPALLGGFSAPGATAVAFFFVLSGFVMATTHRRDFGKVRGMLRFWWRRACRIYPMYWFAMLIPLYYMHKMVTGANAASLFLLSPFATTPFASTDLIPPAWSLRFELAFYLMFGLALLPYAGKPLLALWVGVVCWQWLPTNVLALVHIPPPFLLNHWFSALGGRADRFATPLEFYFFAGLAAGWAFSSGWPGKWLSGLCACVGVAGLAGLLPTIAYGRSYGTPMQALLGGVLLGLLILGMAGLERTGGIRLGKWAARAGMVSYPVYILHAPLGLIFAIHDPHWALSSLWLYGLFAISMMVIFGLSAAAAFFYDQPVQRGLRWLSRKAGARLGAPGRPRAA